MKKALVAICASFALLFAACEESDWEDIISQVVGNADFGVTNAIGTPYEGVDSVHFSSCATNVLSGREYHGTILLGAKIDLNNASELRYPYLGIQINDTVAKSYPLDTLSFSIIDAFSPENMLTEAINRNIIIIAQSDTSWFVSSGGTMNVSEFPAYGRALHATVNSAKMYYITQSKIEAVRNMSAPELLTTTVDQYFNSALINGNITSRRMDIQNLLNSLKD